METTWEQALHQNSVLIFNMALNGLERVVLTIVPHQIRRRQTVDDTAVDRNVFTAADLRGD